MPREIDLSEIMLSQEAGRAWYMLAGHMAEVLVAMRRRGRKMLTIPDDRARVNDDGTLTIFVDIPGVLKVSLEVSAGQWTYGSTE